MGRMSGFLVYGLDRSIPMFDSKAIRSGQDLVDICYRGHRYQRAHLQNGAHTPLLPHCPSVPVSVVTAGPVRFGTAGMAYAMEDCGCSGLDDWMYRADLKV
jgi:hypothetical protein